jgi:hypothetical protein
MVVSQGIISSVIDITRLTCYSYYLLTANRSKSSYQQTVDTFIFQFSIALSYFNYSESFYTNTLTSTLFRKVFRETCRRYYRKLMVHDKHDRNIVCINRLNRNINHLKFGPIGNHRNNCTD